VLVLCGGAAGRKKQPGAPLPAQLEIGRLTFFDFGPPNEYYEVLVVRPQEEASSVQRIILSPPGDACLQPAKIETISSLLRESVASLLENENPCTIPDKELHRELKRCNKCLVFSGQNVTMRFKCGSQTRIIRADILDKDMFDAHPNTPRHTSRTMQLLRRLDESLDGGVMDKPVFPVSNNDAPIPARLDPQISDALASGQYDELFQGGEDKPSNLYRAAREPLPVPSVQLLSSSPFQPIAFDAPKYPPLARIVRAEGVVVADIQINNDGGVKDLTIVSGHKLLQATVSDSVKRWRFPEGSANKVVEIKIEFKANCPAKN